MALTCWQRARAGLGATPRHPVGRRLQPLVNSQEVRNRPEIQEDTRRVLCALPRFTACTWWACRRFIASCVIPALSLSTLIPLPSPFSPCTALSHSTPPRHTPQDSAWSARYHLRGWMVRQCPPAVIELSYFPVYSCSRTRRGACGDAHRLLTCFRGATREHTPRRRAVRAARLPSVRHPIACSPPPSACSACYARTSAPSPPSPRRSSARASPHAAPRAPTRRRSCANSSARSRVPAAAASRHAPRPPRAPRRARAAVCSTASTAARARHSPATRQRPAARASTGPSPPPWRFCLCACGRRAVWRAPALHCAPAHAPPARPRSRTPCPAPRASVLLLASL